jgi:hypothetical protein
MALLGTPVPAYAATYSLTAKASQEVFRTGDGVFFTGTLRKGDDRVRNRIVNLVRLSAEGKATTVASTTTSSSGGYSLPTSPTSSGRYYVRTTGKDAVRSPVLTLRWTRANQRLEERASVLASRLGAAKGGVKSLSKTASRKLDKSATSVRYRQYAKGMLVEVVRSGVRRTWFVPSKIASRYRSTGGPQGAFGLPRRDARCVTLESGCIQKFSKVTVYQSATASSAHYQAGTGRRAEYLATARSQVGYREPSWRGSKYNTWVGASNAWCGIFQSWVAAASGNPDLVPAKTTFPSLVSYAKKNMKTYSPKSKKTKPRAGTLVFFDFRSSRPTSATHVGVLLSRSGGKLKVLEGNSSSGATFTNKRGVYIHTRYVADVLFYADPDW